MAVTSSASTIWNGTLADGAGTTTLASGVGTFAVTWKARADGVDAQTTPEELLAAAHASCFSMALSHGLTEAGTPPTSVATTARVTFAKGQGITGIELSVEAEVPGIDEDAFAAAAADAKVNCPVSKALASVEITLASATLR